MDGDVTAALTGAAQALHDSARAHKQAEFRHRRQARELNRQLDRLRDACAEYGIELRIDNDTDREGHSHG